jgi:hypothetical protein
LYLAFELGWNEWKLAFATAPADSPRLRSIGGRNTHAVMDEIAKAKKRFGLAADAPVRVCTGGAVDDAPHETWCGIDRALRRGLRGLPVSSLSCLGGTGARRSQPGTLAALHGGAHSGVGRGLPGQQRALAELQERGYSRRPRRKLGSGGCRPTLRKSRPKRQFVTGGLPSPKRLAKWSG